MVKSIYELHIYSNFPIFDVDFSHVLMGIRKINHCRRLIGIPLKQHVFNRVTVSFYTSKSDPSILNFISELGTIINNNNDTYKIQRDEFLN